MISFLSGLATSTSGEIFKTTRSMFLLFTPVPPYSSPCPLPCFLLLFLPVPCPALYLCSFLLLSLSPALLFIPVAATSPCFLVPVTAFALDLLLSLFFSFLVAVVVIYIYLFRLLLYLPAGSSSCATLSSSSALLKACSRFVRLSFFSKSSKLKRSGLKQKRIICVKPVKIIGELLNI